MSDSTPAASSVAHVLKQLTSHRLLPDLSLSIRNSIIARARYAAGASQAELARLFGVSYQRVRSIMHGTGGRPVGFRFTDFRTLPSATRLASTVPCMGLSSRPFFACTRWPSA